MPFLKRTEKKPCSPCSPQKKSSKKNGTMKLTSGGTMYDQRDIVLIPFPYSDLTGVKQRPALIVSNALVNHTEDRVCCLVTSVQSPDALAIDSFDKGTLPFPSWTKPHRLFTVSEKIIRKKLCTVTSAFHDRVVREVNKLLR